MTLHYTYVSAKLPENKLRLYPTQVINIIGGPGCEKSLFTAGIVMNLHLRNKTVEVIPDFAKALVWQQDYEALRNQYQIALQQYRMLEALDGQVQFLVCEGSLPQLLYYNEHHPDNICDLEKTRQQILEWHGAFNNVNLVVQRNTDRRYVRAGRFQDENQAMDIDRQMRELLARDGVGYTELPPDPAAIQEFAEALG